MTVPLTPVPRYFVSVRRRFSLLSAVSLKTHGSRTAHAAPVGEIGSRFHANVQEATEVKNGHRVSLFESSHRHLFVLPSRWFKTRAVNTNTPRWRHCTCTFLIMPWTVRNCIKKKKKGGIHTETWNRRRRGEEKEERKILAWHAAAREYNELARQTVET